MVDFIEMEGEKLTPLKTLFEDKVMHRNYETGDLELDLDLLKENHLSLFEYFINNPEDYIAITKKCIKETLELFPDKYDEKGNLLEVSTLPKNILNFKIVNFPKSFSIPIANLRSEQLNSLVILKGLLKMIVKATSKVNRIIFDCPSCSNTTTKLQEESSIQYPTHCGACGKKGNLHIFKEEYENIQEMEMEENVDEIGSRQPQRVRLLLRGDLTDPNFNKFQAGNKVEVIGILKKMPRFISNKEKERVVIDYLIDVIAIKSVESLEEDFIITDDDLEKFKEISQNNPLKILADNLAPTVSDLDYIKKALVLFLAKGVTTYLPSGERKRGEIHILIVSDPGLAKSTLAQNIKKRVVNCRLADGKGSSKAGLVYSIIKDPISERWALDMGDIILANGGYLILDEFDKISEVDREAIHGPMESGMVTISRVGIHANPKSETSILSLANPKMGAFIHNVPIISQIDLPPSLLSRFDLIFAIRDKINEEEDRRKALRILKVHRGEVIQEMSLDLIKKYFLYCCKIKPVVTERMDERLSGIFSKLRQLSLVDGKVVGMPINSRHLEGLIRLSQAHAKIRMSKIVEDIDVDVAEELFTISLNQFGFDEDSRCYDLSRITTKIKPNKRDKYYSGLDILKQIFRLKTEISANEIIDEFQKMLSLNYGDALELLDLLHKQGEVYESTQDNFKLNSKNI